VKFGAGNGALKCGRCRHPESAHSADKPPEAPRTCDLCPCDWFATKGEAWEHYKELLIDEERARLARARREGWA
jgi:hypothetical protein